MRRASGSRTQWDWGLGATLLVRDAKTALQQGQQRVACLKQLSQQWLIKLQIPFVFMKISTFMAQRENSQMRFADHGGVRQA